MNQTVFVDTNILVRFFTNSPIEHSRKVHSLISKADSGTLTLLIHPMIVSETIFTLQSFYKLKPKDIATRFYYFLQSKGIQTIDYELVVDALTRYSNQKDVSYIDAYLAAVAAEQKVPIVSFDRDFDKFNDIEHIQPS